MNEKNGNSQPFELAGIEARLREERATASELELDELKLRAMRQARRAEGTRPKGQWMKSRIALLAMIVLGLMMSTTGATIAITDSGGRSAADEGHGYRLGGGEGAAGGDTLAGEEQADSGSPRGAPSGAAGPGDAQQAKQAAAASDGGDSLPFTGFLAIPLLIGGVGLLGTGAVLRWKSRD
jgi:hypothetical protein